MKLLDTTFLIDVLRDKPGVKDKIFELALEAALYTTEVNVFELIYGVYAGKTDAKKALELATQLIDGLTVLPLDRKSAIRAATIAGTLHRKGRIIEDNDALTAGIALSRGITTIVTRNGEHFGRISEITVEKY